MLSPTNLHPYQRRAIQFILDRPFSALWIGLGLGKTIITLTALEDMLRSGQSTKVLIVGPLRVCNSVWRQEARKWAHTKGLRISICTGTAKERLKALMSDAPIHIINRENLVWLAKHLKKPSRWPYDTVILDESSSFKNSSTKRWRVLRSVRPYIQRMVQLTGTPASNGLLDLWSQAYLLDQGERLGRTKTAYLQGYFNSDFMGYKWEPKDGADEKIHAKLEGLALTLKTEDYLDLPPRIDSRVAVTLPTEAMSHYKALEKDFLLELSSADIEVLSAAALANKLLQIANGAAYDESGQWHPIHEAKLDALKEIVEDNHEPMLVAYNYKSDLARIRQVLPSARVMDKKQETVDAWNRGEIPVLLVHPASAGHGLNLQAGGSLLVFFGLTWSLECYDQLCGRLHRQGQERPVRVVHIVAEQTIDNKVLDALATKARTQRDLLNALKEVMT